MTTAPPREAIAAAVAARRGWAIETLAGWVRHGSVLGQERSAQEYIAGVLDRLGLAVRLLPVDPDRIRQLPGFGPVDWSYADRPNVVGVHDPDEAAGRSLIINGHVDVVPPGPADFWTTPPFTPRVANLSTGDWLYGRGAGDMKGGIVACLWALAVLRELGLEPTARLEVQSVIEEECTGNGTLALCAAGHTADACLIPEPFGETILERQVGVIWFQVRVRGRATHVLGAGRGVNAIEKSWAIIAGLRDLEAELNRPPNVPAEYADIDHPLNLNVGTIEGGEWASTVAAECVTRFRLGLFPGAQVAELRRQIETRVAEVTAADPWLRDSPPAVEYVGFQAPGCTFDCDLPFGRTLAAAHRTWRGADPERLSATCTTDVRTFNLWSDTPATCYGPVAADIHGADERVSLDSMQRIAEVVTHLIGRWCGLRPAPTPGAPGRAP